MADPTRRAILARLRTGEAGVLEIAGPFPMSQPAMSSPHLKVLESAGLVSRRRQAKHHLCRLEAARLRDAADWLGTYREFWEDGFARLDEYVDVLQAEGPGVSELEIELPPDEPVVALLRSRCGDGHGPIRALSSQRSRRKAR